MSGDSRELSSTEESIFFGSRMSFGLVKNGRQRVEADLENREGGLRHRERHGMDALDWWIGCGRCQRAEDARNRSAFQAVRSRIMGRRHCEAHKHMPSQRNRNIPERLQRRATALPSGMKI